MIITLDEATQITARYKKSGNCVGYLTGCFDIIHIGHIDFLRESKKHVDVLVVGIDSDRTIKLSKNKKKPYNSLLIRLEQLDELKSIDYVFPINETFVAKSENAEAVHKHLLELINPNYYIVNILKDAYWKRKAQSSQELGIELLKIQKARNISTTEIFRKLINLT